MMDGESVPVGLLSKVLGAAIGVSFSEEIGLNNIESEVVFMLPVTLCCWWG